MIPVPLWSPAFLLPLLTLCIFGDSEILDSCDRPNKALPFVVSFSSFTLLHVAPRLSHMECKNGLDFFSYLAESIHFSTGDTPVITNTVCI